MMRYTRFQTMAVLLLALCGFLYAMPSVLSPDQREGIRKSLSFLPEWIVPHQANKRIIDATANRMGVTEDKVMMNISRYGNTTAATIPLLLWDYEKQLHKGDNIIMAAFGGGFTWGAMYVKWAYNTN